MAPGIEPTESTDSQITVILFEEPDGRERVPCTSFREAIDLSKREISEGTVAKIENREGEVVFHSAEMAIEDWENEWKRAKQRLSVDVEEYDCPYDSVGCLADDLCVQCKMDNVQDQY